MSFFGTPDSPQDAVTYAMLGRREFLTAVQAKKFMARPNVYINYARRNYHVVRGELTIRKRRKDASDHRAYPYVLLLRKKGKRK